MQTHGFGIYWALGYDAVCGASSNKGWQTDFGNLTRRQSIYNNGHFFRNSGLTLDMVRETAPGIRVRRYLSMQDKGIWDVDGDPDRMAFPITSQQILHSELWLPEYCGSEGCKGTTIGCKGVPHRPGIMGGRNYVRCDIAHPELADLWLAGCDRLIAGYDGVFLDIWDYPDSKLAYADAESWYREHWLPYVTRICEGLRARGMYVVGNCIGWWGGGNHIRFPVESEQFRHVDGALYEYWALDWDGKPITMSSYPENRRKWAGKWAGKAALVESRLQALSDALLDIYVLDNIPPGEPEKLYLSLAMYYIGFPSESFLQKRRWYSFGWSGFPGRATWHPVLDLDLGAPIGDRIQRYSLAAWSRFLERGYVIANFEDQSVRFVFKHPVDGKRRDVTVPPFAGIVEALEEE